MKDYFGAFKSTAISWNAEPDSSSRKQKYRLILRERTVRLHQHVDAYSVLCQQIHSVAEVFRHSLNAWEHELKQPSPSRELSVTSARFKELEHAFTQYVSAVQSFSDTVEDDFGSAVASGYRLAFRQLPNLLGVRADPANPLTVFAAAHDLLVQLEREYTAFIDTFPDSQELSDEDARKREGNYQAIAHTCEQFCEGLLTSVTLFLLALDSRIEHIQKARTALQQIEQLTRTDSGQEHVLVAECNEVKKAIEEGSGFLVRAP